jgi:hypothetical protein
VTYINLDTALFTHGKIIRAGKDARDLFIGALMWSRENLTDGLIPAEVIHLLDPTVPDPATARGLADRLVKVRLMRRSRGYHQGFHNPYQIPDYAEYQQTSEEVKRAREQAKERQRRYRDKHVSNAVTDTVSNASRRREEKEKEHSPQTPHSGKDNGALPDAFTCPHCGIQHKTELKMKDHLVNVHDEEREPEDIPF